MESSADVTMFGGGEFNTLEELFQEVEQTMNQDTLASISSMSDDQLLNTLFQMPLEDVAHNMSYIETDHQFQLEELNSILKDVEPDDEPRINSPHRLVTQAPDLQNDSNSTDKCHVCGNIAGKHSYYGGQVCNSCRAFFRRSVVNHAYQGFTCPESNNCSINSKSRKSCQYCRYQLCLEAGMKPHWILSEIQIQKRKLNGKRKGGSGSKSPLKAELSLTDRYSPDELKHLQTVVSTTKNFINSQLIRYFAKHKELFRSTLKSTYHGKAVGFEFVKKMDKFVHNICLGYYIDLVGDKSLALDDARDLISRNSALITTMVLALYHNPKDILHRRRQLYSEIEAMSSDDALYLREQQRLVSGNNTLVPQGTQYSQLFPTPWGLSQAMDNLHFQLTLKIAQWFPRSSSEHPIDDNAMYLLLIIALFSSDFIELHQPKDVENIQQRYLSMMYRYLKFQYGHRGIAIFSNGILMLSFARQAFEVRMQKSQHTPLDVL